MNDQGQAIPHRIFYSSWDFQQALSAMTFVLEECDFDAKYSRVQLRKFRCFETTAIVSFSRPFKVGRGRKALDLTAIGFEFSEDEERLKSKVLWLRDKIVSHSDEEEMEYRSSPLWQDSWHYLIFNQLGGSGVDSASLFRRT